ncbi:lytic transglycosylase domain-containing protein [Qipengyuania sp. MTN3-11]|uniref:lytic transglycosylase domain-containing protein n=1 Tax=Qipengyuania sp. MTN3-11 TaxID=3056557 RepID=UPI0036F25678
MSSMSRTSFFPIALLAGSALAVPSVANAQDPSSWDRARGNLVASQPGRMAQAIQQWEVLRESDNPGFSTVASFITTYPGLPLQESFQRKAENALDRDPVGPETLVAFFDRHPPLTNSARARYALALATQNRPEAFEVARKAWRGGEMSGPSEAYMLGLYGTRFTPEDHDARMNALLWQAAGEAAARQVVNVSPAMRDMAMARLALVQGETPSNAGLSVPDGALADPGYVYNLARHYRSSGNSASAVNLLATRASFGRTPYDSETFLTEMLRIARGADASRAVTIAAKANDLFPAGTDLSQESYRIRDDWTSLMWLGGTKALWDMGDGNSAAPLFYNYGTAAQTPQTRSKGFYWAGYASARAGNRSEATRYYELAAAYPDRFYGQLALRELGRPVPRVGSQTPVVPTGEQRQQFNAMPLVAATREVARDAPWRTGIQFYRELAQSADTPEEHALVADLAREIGRRDLAVNVAEAAGADGLDGFVVQGFPTLPLPPGANFTLVHAIARQESQFAQNAISHAGARGLMQLMPATAREEAGRAGMQYMTASLIDDAEYNIRLGSNHIERLVSYYDGSYPLAIAAYNAGPGNVNKWLRANGDPRTGAVSWERWIEEIPFFETKNYVQRVIENAAVYEQLYPDRTAYGRARTAGEFLR